MQERPSSLPGNLTPPPHPHSLEMENDPGRVTPGISTGAAPGQRSQILPCNSPPSPHFLYVKNKKFYLTLHPMGQKGWQQERVEGFEEREGSLSVPALMRPSSLHTADLGYIPNPPAQLLCTLLKTAAKNQCPYRPLPRREQQGTRRGSEEQFPLHERETAENQVQKT